MGGEILKSERIAKVKNLVRKSGAACLVATAVLAVPSAWAQADAAVAARLSAGVLAAASRAKEAGAKADAASLARSGALPIQLVKWGQIKSPWREGDFLDVVPGGLGEPAVVVIHGVDPSQCAAALEELSSQPEIERVLVGSKAFVVGEPWRIEELSKTCAELARHGARLVGAGSFDARRQR